jgi:hypothetical protein
MTRTIAAGILLMLIAACATGPQSAWMGASPCPPAYNGCYGD